MNSSIIVVDGYTQEEIESYLNNWIVDYKHDLNPTLEIHVFKDVENKHLLKINDKISSIYFYYLINFLCNPSEFRSNYNIKGYCTGTEKNFLLNIRHLVYVLPNDKEGDNVYCVTENNENYKIEFGGKIMPIRNNVSFSEIYESDINSPLKIVKIENIISQKRKKNISFGKKVSFRVKIIFSIFLIIFFSILLLLIFGSDLIFLNHIITFVSISFALWLYIYEEILQQKKLIIMSLLFGFIGFIINAMILLKTNHNNFIYPIFIGHITIVFVLVQSIIRISYIKLLKKEPRVVGSAGSFSEMIYTIILMIIFFVIPLVTSEYIIKMIL